MKILVLRTENSKLRVEVKVDMMKNATPDDNFTIMTVEGVTENAVLAGIDLKEMPSSLTAMKAYAESRNLLLDLYDLAEDEVEEIVDSVVALDILTSDTMEGGKVDEPYSEMIEIEGGNKPFNFEVTDGNLPDGLTLEKETGVIHGTPDTDDTFIFEVTVTDGFGQTKTKAGLQIEIQAGE